MGGGSLARSLAVLSMLILVTDALQQDEEEQHRLRRKRQIFPSQPRILTENGHLVFQSGTNHNITFRSSHGGGIFIDGLDLKIAVNQAMSNKEAIDRMGNSSTSGLPLTNVTSRLDSVDFRFRHISTLYLNHIRHLDTVDQTLDQLVNRVNQISTQMNSNNNTNSQAQSLQRRVRTLERRNSNYQRRFRRFNNRVQTLESSLRNLRALLTANECLSNPCMNGGTCVDMFNGYFCRCPANWQGPRCTADVNECAEYAGTDLGCQNGATCTNTQGGFTCQCATNWYGIHCSEQHNDCTGASHAELCGHGTCINEDRSQPGQPRYRCICDEGWTTSGSSPACNVDVDECSNGARCSVDPPVTCINIPGSFVCGSCPTGFTGNGYTCADVNECEINNGGCSMNPRVTCVNTRGSRTCGSCPSGYQGDGISCTYVGQCSNNNGGCHPAATCTEDAGGYGTMCYCPDGYTGSGRGPNGCVPQSSSGHCASNPCQNGGSCVNAAYSYVCHCLPGYSGPTCATAVNPCACSVCQNGGTCVPRGSSYVCQCTADYTGVNCQTPQQACGGYLTSPSGSFRYPRQMNMTVPHRVGCAWVITTDTNKIIRITFPMFHLESHSQCNYDFLQIHDGRDASSHMIGKYCGTSPPNGGTINSTHNQLYFWLKTDASVSSDGFQVDWTSHDPVCGGSFTSEHGNISSPGYPGNYPHNRDCVWVVSVGPGNYIHFQFAELRMENHPNCNFDYLEIYDGVNEESPLLNRFCSSQSPGPVDTSGPYAYLRFHSDSSANDRGFHITYSALTMASGGMAGCGSALSGLTGNFESPGFPNSYPHMSNCVWTITAPEGNTIRLQFSSFALENSPDCHKDYVVVRDGLSVSSPLLGTFCAEDIPAPVVSSGNVMYVSFRTDGTGSYEGFSASWSSGCGGVFTGVNGTIQSPNYPSYYPHNLECNYVIQVPSGSRAMLRFTYFALEEDGTDCDYDYVRVYDGPNDSAQSLGGLYCGSNSPSVVQGSTNFLFVKFATDGSVSNHGFQASYSVQEPNENVNAGCGGVFNQNSMTFQSPGHPSDYPHGVSCIWHITVTPGSVIQLSFTSFDIENSGCSYDYVEVFDSYTTMANASSGRFCGNTAPSVQTSTGNVMTVRFLTDGSVSYGGFSASYVAINMSNSGCGAQLTAETGVIQSPGFPNNYPHSRACVWTIRVENGNQILLNFTDFDMEHHRNCVYDYLEIRNGGYDSSPLLQRYCGQMLNMPTILSHSNQLYLKFQSDSSVAHTGFRLEYTGAISGCGGDLSTPSGSIISPGYPESYPHNSQCFWTITVSRASTITMAFTGLDLEHSTSCVYDYIEIREGGPTGRQIAKYCGSIEPHPISSTTNRVWIKYRTDSSVSGGGFMMHYFTNCNNRVTGHSGIIESPNFPLPYDHLVNCTWIIEVAQGNKINVSFAAFSMEETQTCSADYLQIRDGETAGSPTLGRFCSSDEIPGPVRSTRNLMWLNFVSDVSIAHRGFRLEWVVDGCGGPLWGDSGVISSPGYPVDYPHNRECLWTITVSTGKSIQLTINDLNLEVHHNCNFDVLEIYDGSDRSTPRLTKLCESMSQPQSVTSSGNVMFIRFKTDHSISGRGFNASYTANDGGCGGNFTTRTGAFTSVNFPSHPATNTNCEWLITVPQGQVVFLNFTVLDMGYSSRCSDEFVKVYDGANDTSRLIAAMCRFSTTRNATSLGNQMFVRSFLRGNAEGQGFSATYSASCGGTLNADAGGEIFSPNYPMNYPPGKRCEWIITSNYNNRRVFLTFTHMNIPLLERRQPQMACEYSYVQVKDGIYYDVNSTDPEGRYCNDEVPPTIVSQGSALTVVFQSSRRLSGTGFRAVYSTAQSTCGGDFTAIRGSFTSPFYPDSYPVNSSCVWQIRVAPGNTIQLYFSIFSLDPYGSFNSDYVEIRTPDVNGQLLGRWYGSEPPGNLTAMNGAWIKFRSDATYAGEGFVANWSPASGGTITGERGQIASPGYPNLYPRNSIVRWNIVVSQDRLIRIQFLFLEMETPSPACNYDFVEVFDGELSSGTSLGKFCARDEPDVLYSTGSHVTIVFMSDISRQYQGFLLNWTAITNLEVPTTAPPTVSTTSSTSSSCGGNFVATENPTNASTPGYPSGYSNNMHCVWTISGGYGSAITLDIIDIDMEGHGSCVYDSFAVYDGSGTSRRLGTFCSSTGNSEPLLALSGTMRVVFDTDYSVTDRGVAFTYQRSCGGRLTATSGVIQSPEYPNNYPVNKNCSWTIQVQTGKTIGLEFNSFNIPNTGQCNGDFIQILNGFDSDAPPLIVNGSTNTNGRYCGTTPPPRLESSSNVVMIFFVSDGSGTGPGFQIQYSEVAVACGGSLQLSSTVTTGYFMSPNYPNNYPHNIDCIWTISAPSTQRIQVDFEGNFTIEQHSQCRYDYLEFRDGGTSLARPIGDRICGTTRPSTIFSTGNYLFARFRTDSSLPHAGFKVKYSIATCGGYIVATSGTITSKNYPSNYDNNLNCEWTLQVPIGHYLSINITDMDIRHSVNCTADVLEIRDSNSTGPVLFRGCGSRMYAQPISSADSQVYIRFTTDSSESRTGFQLNFRASTEECGGDLDSPSGVITSPNYPRPTTNRRICVWNLRVTSGRRITLTFDDVEQGSDTVTGHCISMFNGILRDSPLLRLSCRGNNPDPIMSSGNTMRLMFRSDSSIPSIGFRLHYTSNLEAECGGVLQGDSGNITSPGYGAGGINHSLECQWRILNNRPQGGTLKITIRNFHIENHPRCNYDFLEIREGMDNTGQLVDRLCGYNVSQEPIILPSSEVWIRLRTDSSVTSNGFVLNYEFSECGSVKSDPQGEITSPNYPNNYDNLHACAWKIVAPEGSQIQIEFMDFSFENSSTCRYDYIQFQNGGNYDSPVMGKYCGVTPPSTFRSQSNQLRLIMRSDYSVQSHGFRLRYTVQSAGCGGTFHASNGSLSSPGHPSNYPHNTECRWDINVNVGRTVILTFIPPFDLEADSSDCRYDYVEVFDGLRNGTLISRGRWCSNVNPPVLTSVTNRMVVTFRSDFSSNGHGFAANWTLGCGGLFTELTGQLYSPNYPDRYENDMDCNYTISPGEGQHIALTFQDFRLEGSGSCNYDSVEVWSGNGTDRRRRGRFCGSNVPENVVARDMMHIRFKTDLSVTYRGFKARYFSESCGGVLTNPTGRIRSPVYPNRYFNNHNCNWSITVVPNRIIKFKFTRFDLEMHSRCRYDYVEMFDGPDTSSNLIGRFCGQMSNIPSVMTTTGNQMFMTFITDSSVTRAGFTGSYWTTFGPAQGCGGHLRQASGQISSIDADGDGQYEHNLECDWLIYVDVNKVVVLNISSVDIESHTNCMWDNLVVYDGMSKDDAVIGTFCGQRSSIVLHSTSNVILVSFTTDSSVTGSGFNATFTQTDSVCGGAYNVTSEPVTLSSPNIPATLGRPVRCRWILDSVEPNSQVKVTVTSLQLASSSTCENEYLLVRDKPMLNLGRELYYCGSTLPQPFYSRGQQVAVIFRIPAASSTSSFQLQYETADCNRNYTANSGQITSPGYPADYHHRADCIMRVTASPGTTLSIYFNDFRIEQHSSCRWDSLQIMNSSMDVLDTLCGHTVPSPYHFSDNQASLRFRTDYSVNYAGFDITYVASTQGPGCGGNITNILSGVITSPNFPGNFSNATTCSWYITPPAQQSMWFAFASILRLGDSGSCSQNYVEIFMGTTTTSPTAGRFCDSGLAFPRIFSDTILVNLVSSGQGSAPVFRFVFSKNMTSLRNVMQTT